MNRSRPFTSTRHSKASRLTKFGDLKIANEPIAIVPTEVFVSLSIVLDSKVGRGVPKREME